MNPWMGTAVAGAPGTRDQNEARSDLPARAACPTGTGLAAAILDRTPDLVVTFDPGGRILATNRAGDRLLRQDGPTTTIDDILGPGASLLTSEPVRAALEAHGSWMGVVRIRLGDRMVPMSTVLVAAGPPRQPFAALTLVARDLTHLEARPSVLLADAPLDPLTGLPTRDAVLEHLARTPRPVALLHLDVDRFTTVNDSLGHEAGNDLLVQFARRLLAAVRPEDLVGRLGGDEFVVVCGDVLDDGDALRLAERVRMHLEEPFALGGRRIGLTVSIGVARDDGAMDGDRPVPDEVLANAAAATSQAKSQGRARCALFDAQLRERAQARLALEADLRGALDRRELHLVYQPQHALTTGAVVGIEALLRWRRRSGATASPAEFIPIAEETGLIVPIGSWVLQEACRQVRAWTEVAPSAARLLLHVNLSTRQFLQPDLVEMVRDVMTGTGIDPTCLCLEVTETAVMEAVDLAADTLGRLRSLGVRVAIDDFGTGHSSLSYLRRLPVDVIKLDKSFIDRLGEDEVDAAIVVAVINLARSLGLSIVAEGVESDRQRRELRALGCGFAQGFYFSRPVPPDEIPPLLTA